MIESKYELSKADDDDDGWGFNVPFSNLSAISDTGYWLVINFNTIAHHVPKIYLLTHLCCLNKYYYYNCIYQFALSTGRTCKST